MEGGEVAIEIRVVSPYMNKLLALKMFVLKKLSLLILTYEHKCNSKLIVKSKFVSSRLIWSRFLCSRLIRSRFISSRFVLFRYLLSSFIRGPFVLLQWGEFYSIIFVIFIYNDYSLELKTLQKSLKFKMSSKRHYKH